jgi:hypothetical protein
MVNQDSSIAPGFTLYFSEKHNQRFLLPIATVAQLAAQANLASQAPVSTPMVLICFGKIRQKAM